MLKMFDDLYLIILIQNELFSCLIFINKYLIIDQLINFTNCFYFY